MNIIELFLSAASSYPDKKAIIETNSFITYSELVDQVEQTASYYKKKGVKKGDRIMVFVPMSIDLYRIVLALFYIGATAVFLDEWVGKKRMETCCNIADCKGFIGGAKIRILSLFYKELRKIPIKLSLNGREKSYESVIQVDPNTSALITFTTGSTGVPKAADRTHGFLRNQFDALIDEIDPRVDDIDMPVLPIVLFVNLGVGCTSIITSFRSNKPESLDARSIANQILFHKVNRITASPFFVKRIAKYALDNKINLNSLKKIFTGGAPVFHSEAKIYGEAFPFADTRIVYGSTEVEPISSISGKLLLDTENQLLQGLPVGIIYNKLKVRIIKITKDPIPKMSLKELDAITLKDGEMGEIIVSGPHVLKQYFRNQEAFIQNKILCEKLIWHRTGDSGIKKINELLLTGRCTQLIIDHDNIISPFIIENRLQSLAGIEIGTILKLNELIYLVVESKLTKSKIIGMLGDIRYDEIVVIKKIPRDPRHHSKIDYSRLNTIVRTYI